MMIIRYTKYDREILRTNCTSSITADAYSAAIAACMVHIEVNQLQRDARYAFACAELTRKPFLRDTRDFLDPFDALR